MANGLDTMPGDEMDVDIDIDLGPIDIFPEGDLDELVRDILARSGGSSVRRLTQMSRILLSPPSPSHNPRAMAMARFCS